MRSLFVYVNFKVFNLQQYRIHFFQFILLLKGFTNIFVNPENCQILVEKSKVSRQNFILPAQKSEGIESVTHWNKNLKHAFNNYLKRSWNQTLKLILKMLPRNYLEFVVLKKCCSLFLMKVPYHILVTDKVIGWNILWISKSKKLT